MGVAAALGTYSALFRALPVDARGSTKYIAACIH
jgi:hypothetical protein